MAAPTFTLIQGTSLWTSGSTTEFSTTGGAGAQLGSLSAAINFSNSALATGPQTTGAWAAANPVPVGSNSYEFIFGLKVTGLADNSISNMRMWSPTFSAITGVTFYAGTVAASGFSTPVATASSKATTNFTAITDQSSAYLIVTAPANVVNALSSPIYLQARTTGSASGGNQSGCPSIALSLDWA